jgi:hypothetical protein
MPPGPPPTTHMSGVSSSAMPSLPPRPANDRNPPASRLAPPWRLAPALTRFDPLLISPALI